MSSATRPARGSERLAERDRDQRRVDGSTAATAIRGTGRCAASTRAARRSTRCRPRPSVATLPSDNDWRPGEPSGGSTRTMPTSSATAASSMPVCSPNAIATSSGQSQHGPRSDRDGTEPAELAHQVRVERDLDQLFDGGDQLADLNRCSQPTADGSAAMARAMLLRVAAFHLADCCPRHVSAPRSPAAPLFGILSIRNS